MELEELKNTWNLINNRMMQKEGMEAAIIKEMLVAKSDKAFSRMTNYDYFSVIVCMGVIGLLTYLANESDLFRAIQDRDLSFSYCLFNSKCTAEYKESSYFTQNQFLEPDKRQHPPGSELQYYSKADSYSKL